MTIPTHDELMLPFLQVLSDGQEHRINELVDKLAKEFNLSQKEIEEEIPSGGRKFAGRVGWARTYLKGAKLIDSPKRAFFIINERGRKALSTCKLKDTQTIKLMKKKCKISQEL